MSTPLVRSTSTADRVTRQTRSVLNQDHGLGLTRDEEKVNVLPLPQYLGIGKVGEERI